MADSGRLLLIKKGATAIAGAQENGITMDNSPVDVTSISSAGWRELADFAGTRSLDVSVSGVWGDKVIRDQALASTDTGLLMTDITLDFADGGSILGDFYLSNYTETGTHNDAVKFTASLLSSGVAAYTSAV